MMDDEQAWSVTHSIALVSRIVFYWVWIVVGIVILVLAFRGYLMYQEAADELDRLGKLIGNSAEDGY